MRTSFLVKLLNAIGDAVNPATEDSLLNFLFEKNCAVRIYTVTTNTYICKAVAGSSTASAVWKIKRIDVDGNTTWADGNTNQDNVADDYVSLSYS